MIMALKATESGAVNHNLSPGSVIQAGDLIASLKLKDPSKVKQIATFKVFTLYAFAKIQIEESMLHYL